jgi:T5SS/PEP-CTERM-associated repeat protein/autotransporter-associated beta strand protein
MVAYLRENWVVEQPNSNPCTPPSSTTSSTTFGYISIVTSGNVTATTGAPYNGTDNPWSTFDLTVGHTAPGSLSISDGFVVKDTGFSTIADQAATTTSSVTVDGAGSAWNITGSFVVGNAGEGSLSISGGGSVSSANSLVANQEGAVGTVTVGGGSGSSSWTLLSTLIVGVQGTGTLNIIGGSSVSDPDARIAFFSNSNGTVNVGDGTGAATWTNSSSLLFGSGSSAGKLNINAGGLVSATALDGGNAASSVNFDGGTLSITGTDSASHTMKLLAGGGTIDVPTALTTFTISSAIGGTGNLTKTGQATLALTGANGYSGNTLVTAGTLKLSGSGSFASSSAISLATGTKLDVAGITSGANFSGGRFSLVSGQTLKGTGTVVGSLGVASGATIAPGNSVGTLATDSVSIASGGTLALEVDFGGPGSADYLNNTGTLALNNSILNLTLLNGLLAGTLPETFLVANNVTGTFGSVTGLTGPQAISLNYAFSGTDALGRIGDGNDLAITVITAVPEARAWLMLGLVGGTAVLFGFTRRARPSIASRLA